MKGTKLLVIILMLTSFTFFSCSDKKVKDIDGNVYKTVKIGNQLWMAENLKVTHYRDGHPIHNLTDDDDWTSTNDGAYCYYDNSFANGDTYGALYNWHAVDNRNIAPEGWHVPTEEEIKELEMYLGMSQSEADDGVWRGTNEGSKLAGNLDLWSNGDLENNAEFGTSGFSFLPGGYRYYYGNFSSLGYFGYFWSATEYDAGYAWSRILSCSGAQVGRVRSSKQSGFSLRCIRD